MISFVSIPVDFPRGSSELTLFALLFLYVCKWRVRFVLCSVEFVELGNL